MKRLAHICLIVAVVGAVSPDCRNSAVMSGRKVRIAEGTQPIAAPIYVAQAKGYFKDEGLDAELVPFPTGKLCLDALIGGNVEFATAAETPIVHASFTKQPIKIVATFQRARENTYLVARIDRGINSPSDLKGKIVGVPLGTNAEYALGAFLARHGLEAGDLNLTNLSPPEMIGPLTRGDVTAVVGWEPHAGRSRKALAANGIRFSFSDVYEETYNLVSTTMMAVDEPDTVVKVLRAMDRAVAYMKANRQETIEIVAQRLGMEASELDVLWPLYHFDLDLRISLLDLLDAEGKWAVAVGHQKTGTPDMRTLIAGAALRTVKPEAVELP